MRISFLIVALCIVFAVCGLLVGASASMASYAGSCPKGGEHTLYSGIAMSVHDTNPHWLRSPDGRKRLKAVIMAVPSDPNGMQVKLTVEIDRILLEDHLSGWGSEIAWSSDSKAFFVTQTEGGGGIGIRTYVFYVDGTNLRKVNVSQSFEGDYRYPAQCGGDIESNIVAIAWVDGSHRLLIAAEAPPVAPLCQCPGEFKAYEIRLPDNVIIRSFSESEAKRRFWRSLGCQLREAYDKCAK